MTGRTRARRSASTVFADGAEALAPRPTLSQRVSHHITKSILRGDFSVGAFLPTESELAQSFKVSRAVIREAVKEVAALGLVRSQQGRGTQVAPVEQWRHFARQILLARMEIGTADEALLEVLELRRIIEIEAAGLAAARATDDEIEAMRQHLDAMEAHLRDVAAFTRHDIAFHDALLRATRNHLLPQLFEQLRPLLELARAESLRTRPGGIEVSQAGHRAIFAAVVDRAVDRARQAMAEHLSWTANLRFADRDVRLSQQPTAAPSSRLLKPRPM